ncbi:hypothetical protein DER45DRAFT_614491 [Fusarium avenaceum]|nr:hypothetical protein DER45DRAFT_614491 [Fusarium avenaceum]
MSQSPYYGSTTRIRFGDQMTAWVPKQIIASHPKFATHLASLKKNEGYDFTNVDKRVGHVILHFLFTGEYQALPMVEESVEKTRRGQFFEVINVYLEASEMGLDRLVTLSESEIERQGRDMTSADVFTVIGEDFVQEAVTGEWLKNYLLRRASSGIGEVKPDDIKKIQQRPLEERNVVSLLLEANMELKKELQKYKKLSNPK